MEQHSTHQTIDQYFTNPRMHLFHIPQCSIQNRNVNISVLNGALWDMEQVHSGICKLGQFQRHMQLSSNTDFNQAKFSMGGCFCDTITHCPLEFTWTSSEAKLKLDGDKQKTSCHTLNRLLAFSLLLVLFFEFGDEPLVHAPFFWWWQVFLVCKDERHNLKTNARKFFRFQVRQILFNGYMKIMKGERFPHQDKHLSATNIIRKWWDLNPKVVIASSLFPLLIISIFFVVVVRLGCCPCPIQWGWQKVLSLFQLFKFN